jgi:hypothetical protein
LCTSFSSTSSSSSSSSSWLASSNVWVGGKGRWAPCSNSDRPTPPHRTAPSSLVARIHPLPKTDGGQPSLNPWR